jgi:hypothetical protein
MRRSVSVLAAVLLTAGCYRYEAMPAPTPVVGMAYRARLSSGGVEAMAPVLGRDVTTFDGSLQSASENAWRFAISRTQTREGRLTGWVGEAIDVPRDAVASMQQRVLDRPKTLRAAILGTIGGIALGLAVKSIAGGATGNPGGPIVTPP